MLNKVSTLALAVTSTLHVPVLAARLPLPRAISSKYTLIADYSGPTFFDNFNTFTGPDPTEGSVTYLDMKIATGQKLLGFVDDRSNLDGSNTSNAYLGVDYSSSNAAKRSSVRLDGKQSFQPGTLAVLDVKHIPVADGVWPAIWFLGDAGNGTWPANGGEVDLLEYVGQASSNSITLHTAPGCHVANYTSSPAGMSPHGNDTHCGNMTHPGNASYSGGTSRRRTASLQSYQQGVLLNTNCNSGSVAGTQGCSVSTSDSTATMPTAGKAFNDQRGGVYAQLWTLSGITVWLFSRDALPTDLVSGTPSPESWTQTPLARFTSGTGGCDFTTALADLKPIINIDFCGGWADQAWNASDSAQRTGAKTCEEYVAGHPEAFKEAYFEIASLRFYGQGAVKPSAAKIVEDVVQENAQSLSFPTIDIKDRM